MATRSPLRAHWIDEWDPEDEGFWTRTGAKIANRNLFFSVLSEHIGFSIWTPVVGDGAVHGPGVRGRRRRASSSWSRCRPWSAPSLRLPYTFAVARFGGRNWTIVSAALLLVPTVLAAFVMQPGTSYTTFLVVAALTGVGGGNFASSMTNINAFFPGPRKGWALGLNAGGGNIGVPVIQLIGLAVIATAGASAPRIVLGIYIPLIVVAAVLAAPFMDNLTPVSNDTGAFVEAVRDRHTWIMSFLYIGTFGSFIGYSFAFGLVLQNQFGRTPLQAASLTFIGPLLGSLIRPVGGRLADRFGGARITFWNFVAMAVATGGDHLRRRRSSRWPCSPAAFVLLFVLTGLGNGSTYKMIPGIFRGRGEGGDRQGRGRGGGAGPGRRLSGASIGLIGAVGALGGLGINLAFRQSFLTAKTGDPASSSFLAFYAVCAVVTWAVYLRRPPPGPRAAAGLRRRVTR